MKKITEKHPMESYREVHPVPVLGLTGVELDACYQSQVDPLDYYFEVHPSDSNGQICPVCGTTSFTKEGVSKPRIVHDLLISGRPVRIRAKVPRYKCKGCGYRFNHQYEAFLPDKQLTVRLNETLQYEVFSNSLKQLEKRYYVNISTLMEILNDAGRAWDNARSVTAPFHLGIDRTMIKEQPCYILTDVDSCKIIEITEDDSVLALDSALSRIKDPERVHSVITDMDADCDDILHSHFPNAKLVVDRIHFMKTLSNDFSSVYQKLLDQLEIANQNLSDKKQRGKIMKDLKKARIHDYLFRFSDDANQKLPVDLEEADDLCRKFPELDTLHLCMNKLKKIYIATNCSNALEKLERCLVFIKQSALLNEMSEMEVIVKKVIQSKEKIGNYFLPDQRINNHACLSLEAQIQKITRNGGSRKFDSIRYKLLFANREHKE